MPDAPHHSHRSLGWGVFHTGHREPGNEAQRLGRRTQLNDGRTGNGSLPVDGHTDKQSPVRTAAIRSAPETGAEKRRDKAGIRIIRVNDPPSHGRDHPDTDHPGLHCPRASPEQRTRGLGAPSEIPAVTSELEKPTQPLDKASPEPAEPPTKLPQDSTPFSCEPTPQDSPQPKEQCAPGG